MQEYSRICIGACFAYFAYICTPNLLMTEIPGPLWLVHPTSNNDGKPEAQPSLSWDTSHGPGKSLSVTPVTAAAASGDHDCIMTLMDRILGCCPGPASLPRGRCPPWPAGRWGNHDAEAVTRTSRFEGQSQSQGRGDKVETT
jgi:hypothetical protein